MEKTCQRLKIAVDPGHGPGNHRRGVYDPGAVCEKSGTCFEEAAIVLDYALALQDALRASGHEVFRTRDAAGVDAPVRRRAAIARQAGCGMFISLHLNAHTDNSANGLEVLYGNDSFAPLAQRLQDALVKVTGLRDRMIKLRTDLAVLRFDGPAVLIELGFISHDADRNVLLDPAKRQEICETIANEVVK